MEIYKAVCDFVPPNSNYGVHKMLSFQKGEKFEILETYTHDSDWWGARSLADNSLGYVPSKYLKYDERRVGRQTSTEHKVDQERMLKQLAALNKPRDDPSLRFHEPPPDYITDDLDPKLTSSSSALHQSSSTSSSNSSLSHPNVIPYRLADEDTTDSGDTHNHHVPDFIPSKKLPNPCIDSKERQALHNELLMNKKLGIDVLQKQSELEKKLKEREEMRRRKEHDEFLKSKRTSLEKVLEQRANMLQQDEAKQMKTITEGKEFNKEYQKIHAKITSKPTVH